MTPITHALMYGDIEDTQAELHSLIELLHYSRINIMHVMMTNVMLSV